MSHGEIAAWLRESDPVRLEELRTMADCERIRSVGDEVHLRGLIEVSNHCSRRCAYCGIGAGSHGDLQRYRMTDGDVLACANRAREFDFGTVVMQSGEDYGITREWLADVVRRVKAETGLAVTLSMGERPLEDAAEWRRAGADRYLLRFETSDPELFAIIHPGRMGVRSHPDDRLLMLAELRKMGYEVGSGVMVGIPGQTFECLANDLLTFARNDFDMIGIGPFICDPDTPLGRGEVAPKIIHAEQAPATELMTCKALALTRLLCPRANIPSTTALATINPSSGRRNGLAWGANVFMPNLTPAKYRSLYAIYPRRVTIDAADELARKDIVEFLASIGRRPGQGHGGRTRG